MIIFKSINKLNKEVNFKANIGFVPTMGALHKGHISLIKSSKKICKKTLVSIFINPSQFNKKIDLNRYPKNLKKDIKILKKIKVDYVLIPKVNDLYKLKKDKKIKLKKRDKIMCALYRPGHFEGVLAVINQFLIKLKPKYMFLGEKDYQQLFLIKKNIKKKFKVKIISCKTIRNNNFLALSSRNYLLSKKNLKMSGQIAKKLYLLKKKITNNYKFKNQIGFYKKYLTKKYNIKFEYLEARKEKDLTTFKNKSNFRLFVAYYINKVRLIDNY